MRINLDSVTADTQRSSLGFLRSSPPRAKPIVEESSVFAPGVEIDGDLDSRGAVFLQGSFKGRLDAPHLSVGSSGSLRGLARCELLETRGRVDGELLCHSLVSFAGARVTGVVRSGSVQVQPGGVIEADVEIG